MATWALDPSVTHLNHGSFGATPVEVLEVQAGLRSAMERNPVDFMLHQYQPLLEENRTAVAKFVGADRDGLVFVPNATYGVNSVLRSLEGVLAPGGEILLTNQTYNACINAATVTAERIGGTVVVADVPFPAGSASEVTDAVLQSVTDKTVLVMLDHVTSPTGTVWPVGEIAKALEPAIPVLIDGAHAPGMIELDLAVIGASFYTANCHKWICSPKGAAFLHVADRYRDVVRSASVSHGYNDGWPESGSRFHAQFDWTGTDDPSARLSVASALDVMGAHHRDGWAGIRSSNHALVLEGRRLTAEAIGTDELVAEELLGSIAAVPLPLPKAGGDSIFDSLMNELHHRWKIEVPVFTWPESPARVLRISAQQYNTLQDYERLAEALHAELR